MPAGNEELLMTIVGAVADGEPVDWSRAESTPLSDEERSLLAQLKVLEGLHRLHRSGTPASSPSQPKDPDANTVHVAEPQEREAHNGDTNVVTASPPMPRTWGPLEIRGVLGCGGFGVVYQAWDPHLASDVALKVLTSEKAGAGATVVQEARLLARVRHPNIVSIYGAERSEGQVGLWMELVRGRTLKQIVKQQGVFSAREAALVGLDLTRALAAVHGAGLVHRDVKPHNVMRDDSGRIILMDFGAGIELKELSDDPQRKYVGTPLYMAPELFARQQPSAQTDLYSLGILLYHLVTGAYPIEGKGPEEVELQHVRGERRRLRDVRPDLPTEFVRIVERASDPDASRRYGSAGAMEADLAHFVVKDDRAAAPQAAVQPAGVVPPRRGARWSRATLVLAALLVLVTAGISTVTFRSWRRAPVPSAVPAWRSLVVLPFLNLSGNPADEYFADGMTDLLTADLSMIPGLKVISRTSAMSFKSSKKPLPEIARALNVGGVIEGSIAKTGDRVQITLQVIEAGTDLHLWSNRYEGRVSDISALDGEIARRIAREIGAALTPKLQQRLSTVRAVRPDALDEYLKGKYAANAYTEAGDREALAHFTKAAELDPEYALARVGLANVYRTFAIRSSEPARSDYFRLAREAALRGRQLDDGLPGAHLALANIELYADWDWSAAERDFARALELNANDPDAHQQYAWFLAARGDVGRALTHAQAARELDPLGLIRRTTAAGIMYYSRMYPQAIKELRDVVDLDPSFVVAHVGLARTYAAIRMFHPASDEINRAIELYGRQTALVAALGRIYADAGRPVEARRVLDELVAMSASGTRVEPGSLALLYASLGQPDRAFGVLEAGVRDHLAELLWIKVDPSFDVLRKDPRFDRLLSQSGLRP
jgi:TolB-like protein/Tfp pilus assembly protein PilF